MGVVKHCENKAGSQSVELQSYRAASGSHPSLHSIIKLFLVRRGFKTMLMSFQNIVFNINCCFIVLVKIEIIFSLNMIHSHSQVVSLHR